MRNMSTNTGFKKSNEKMYIPLEDPLEGNSGSFQIGYPLISKKKKEKNL